MLRCWFVVLIMLASMGLTVVRLQAQVRPERVRIGENIAAGMVAKKVQPVYPSEARSQQISGAVRMQINISKKGDVEDVKVVSGDPIVAPAAMAAVKQWKHKPSTLSGEVIAVQTRVTVTLAPTDR